MKLYTSARAPNPRRVHVYLAEKGLDVATEIVDLGQGQQFSESYRRINPDGVVPTLVLDDGTVICESIAICRYFEAVHPDPPLFGTDARQQALVQMWLRRLEIQAYIPVQDAFRNSRSGFVGRALPGYPDGMEQIPQLVARANAVFGRTLARLDAHLDGRSFIVDDAITMADIVAMVAIDFARSTKMDVACDLGSWPALVRWHEAMTARPSASARPSGS